MIGRACAACVDVLLLLVLGLPWMVARRLRGREDAPLGARLGRVAPLPPATGPRVWLHAVSVGETLALRALVRALGEGTPSCDVVLTVTTVKGLETARETYGRRAVVLPSPVDVSFAVERMFDAIHPDVLVLAECELWPNLLRVARRRGVPVVVVNARLSARSVSRYRVLAALFPWVFRSPERWLAQTPDHARRLEEVGVPPARIDVAGNVKADNVSVEDPSPTRERVRRELGISEAAGVVVAGSTHPGEHDVLIRRFVPVAAAHPEARLVIAPRHMERVADVVAACEAAGLRHALWTRRESPENSGASVWIVDVMGQLANLYAAADLAFVGGTWVPVGGHNPLEPCRFGIPVVVGTWVASIRDVVALLSEAGSLDVVADEEDLARRLRDVAEHPSEVRRRGSSAAGVIERSRGATARAEAAIRDVLARPRS